MSAGARRSADRASDREQLIDIVNAVRGHVHAITDLVAEAVILQLNGATAARAELQSGDDARRIVDVATAAAYLSLSDQGLRDLVARSLVPCIRLPSTRGSRPIMRFDLDDLDRYLDELKGR